MMNTHVINEYCVCVVSYSNESYLFCLFTSSKKKRNKELKVHLFIFVSCESSQKSVKTHTCITSDDNYGDDFLISIKSVLQSKGTGTEEGEQDYDLVMDSVVKVENIGIEITLTKLKTGDLQGERNCYKIDSSWDRKTKIDFQDLALTFSMKFSNKSLKDPSAYPAIYTENDIGNGKFVIEG